MFSDPEHNVQQFGLTPGMQVADFGAGSGFYTVALARAVGSNGHVYALEVQKELLARIKAECEKQKLNNVDIIWSNIEKLGGTKLRERTIDAAVVSNVFFQIEHKDMFASELKRVLKPGARVLFVEWSDSYSGMGPAQSAVVPQSRAEEFFRTNGFEIEHTFPAGAHHYGLILRK